MTTTRPDTPELDKRAKCMVEASTITEFVDWLFSGRDSGGFGLVPARHSENYYGVQFAEPLNWERVLEEYFELDSAAIEREQRALYEWLREQNKEGA